MAHKVTVVHGIAVMNGVLVVHCITIVLGVVVGYCITIIHIVVVVHCVTVMDSETGVCNVSLVNDTPEMQGVTVVHDIVDLLVHGCVDQINQLNQSPTCFSCVKMSTVSFLEIICVCVQANTCYIDNMCYIDGGLNPQDARWACKPGISQDQWSVVGSKQACTHACTLS